MIVLSPVPTCPMTVSAAHLPHDCVVPSADDDAPSVARRNDGRVEEQVGGLNGGDLALDGLRYSTAVQRPGGMGQGGRGGSQACGGPSGGGSCEALPDAGHGGGGEGLKPLLPAHQYSCTYSCTYTSVQPP